MNKKSSEFTKSLLAIILGLAAGAVMMILIGENPFEGYFYLFKGAFMSVERILNIIGTGTALVLTGLSVAFAFKTGLFNIGAAGQMLVGGMCASTVGLMLPAPRIILLPTMFLAAAIGGGLWGAVPGYLKAKFNVHEVVATIMMNWIAYWIAFYYIPSFIGAEFMTTESALLPAEASLKMPWLTNLTNGSYINLGIVVSIAMVIIAKFILDRTTIGYELKAVGHNRHAALYAGIKVNKSVILSMVIAGAFAGLAGYVYYCGYSQNMQIGKLPSLGFDGIAVALLGASSPWGVFAAAMFFGLLHSAKGFMNAMTGIPPQISDTIIAIIIYFTATSLFAEKLFKKLIERCKEKFKSTKGGES